MLDPAPLLEGIWSEVLSRQDEIPSTQRVRVVPDVTDSETDDVEHEKRLRLWDELFARADAMEMQPPPEPPSPLAQSVVDKFRRQGFKL